MTAGFPAVSPVRKELRSIGPCTPAHIFDGVAGNTGVSELELNERSEVPVRLCAVPSNNSPAVASRFHLLGDFFTDLECLDPNMRTDGHDELGAIVCQGVDGTRYDPGNRATPTRVHRSNVSARWMRDQHRHTVGRSRCNAQAFDARDQRIAFFIGDRFGEIGV